MNKILCINVVSLAFANNVSKLAVVFVDVGLLVQISWSHQFAVGVFCSIRAMHYIFHFFGIVATGVLDCNSIRLYTEQVDRRS